MKIGCQFNNTFSPTAFYWLHPPHPTPPQLLNPQPPHPPRRCIYIESCFHDPTQSTTVFDHHLPRESNRIDMFVKFALALAFAGVVLAAPSNPQYGYTPPEPVYDDPPRYDFNYAVKDYSNNDFGHQENRDGYNTNGGYSVLLPDGRLQRVTYTVNGDEGYIAEVTYEGEAQYPAHQPAPYHPTPAPYRPTPAPYHPTPAPYH
ncbi:uncharacterized protein LOC143036229 [Oratosquilla oratoria]|uniref:uncharacterized protein LOC143036229 n=1 Tax=Oratosquilla oratoria TaxID=337810 RepID=UPI003F766E63